MNIKDKLRYYHKTVENEYSQDEESECSRLIPEQWQSLAETTGGKIVKEGSGYFYYMQRVFDISFETEFFELKERGFILENLPWLAPELNDKNVNLKDVLFFDLETSGLSGGSGTIAFLIGAAHVSMNQIVVHQWVMPDFADEYLILNHFNKLLKEFNYISTFNGKSFDAPIIKNRFILNQLIPSLEDKLHIDLLHISRRIWKKRLQSCRLQNLEKEILFENRVEDIPGELIPSVYFGFLYGNGLDDFKKILEHNYLDLVNLVRIGIKLEFILSDPVKRVHETDDFLEIVGYLKKQKQYKLVETLLKSRLDIEESQELFYEFALALKKNKKYDLASKIFKKLTSESYFPLELVEEYTKILEHNLKDYSTAIELLEKKIKKFEIIEQLNVKIKIADLERLNARMKRIQNKLKNKK